MPNRRALVRLLTVTGLIAAGCAGVVGGLSLRGPGLVAVGVAGALAACLGWGMAREATGPAARSAAESATMAAAWTVGALLVLSGTSVIAGGGTASLVAGVAAATAVVRWVVRTPEQPGAVPSAPAVPAAPRSSTPHPSSPSPQPDGLHREGGLGVARTLPPVPAQSTEALGCEWLDSTTRLAGRMQPADRETIVLRRQEMLDELERRDPVGYRRWLDSGPDSDPAAYVRGKAGEAAGESPAGAV